MKSLIIVAVVTTLTLAAPTSVESDGDAIVSLHFSACVSPMYLTSVLCAGLPPAVRLHVQAPLGEPHDGRQLPHLRDRVPAVRGAAADGGAGHRHQEDDEHAAVRGQGCRARREASEEGSYFQHI